jgi:tetratricopeptide (TPR) repeat protein
MQESVKLQPGISQMHYGLGVALSKSGRLAEAESSLKRVLQLDPTNLQAVFELAVIELRQNKLPDAETHFKQIVAKDPSSLNALMGLARVYRTWNKSDLAISYYKRALKMNPNIASAHQDIGAIYMNQGQTDLAEASYKKALKIAPENIAVYLEIGQLYLRTNYIDMARESFEKALSMQPDNIDVLTSIAQLKEQSGEVQAAYELIASHIDKGVNHVDMSILFSRLCKHVDRCDDAARYLEQLLAHSEDTVIRKCKLNFALGRLYDNLGRYDEAFKCYKKGNDLKGNSFNQVEHTFCIDTLIKYCDWNFFLNAPRSTQSTERPVFIVGMPRSGTTLTEQILCSHPEVFGAGEILAFPNIIMNLPRHLGAGSVYPDNLKNLTTTILDNFSNTYLGEINKLDDIAPRVLDKTLANFLYIGLISLMFPNAKIIYCKRDPRDTCLSIYFQNFDDSHNYSTTLENIGFYYEEYDRLMKHWKSILNIPIMEVQYEDVVKDQEMMSRKLIDFVGLEWDESVLMFYDNKRSVVTASYDQVRQKIYTKSTERWKKYEKHLAPLIDNLKL